MSHKSGASLNITVAYGKRISITQHVRLRETLISVKQNSQINNHTMKAPFNVSITIMIPQRLKKKKRRENILCI